MHTVEALDSLILFRQKPDSLLRRLMSSEEAVRVATQGELVALAVENGWQGDLWRCCIAWTLTEHENPFSLSWERRTGPGVGSPDVEPPAVDAALRSGMGAEQLPAIRQAAAVV